MYKEIKEKIELNIRKTDTCWLWIGRLWKTGYGVISYKSKGYGAHRVLYEIYKGKIPKGLEIDHLCRVRHCVNPEHLEAVTQRVNLLRGESPAAKSARRNTCLHGHKYTKKNTYLSLNVGAKRLHRVCKTCHMLTERRRRKRMKESGE